ncbi:solute carrier family 22 member 16 isoform X1 [Ornithorhynchus anatinus]|uniref:Solute carrier family 22 member 16 n=1 Tax=Ornithorhynchus anatinus TaxID=9258 RepID=A0A6I8P9G3_ORNAN|nr:solute carrier family 22 member 16 isoform X1 [Ornithorhynchus anatinus]
MGARHLEPMLERVGQLGRFQAFVYFTSVFQAISCGIHYLASVFMAVTPKFFCGIMGNVSQIVFHNSSSLKMEDSWALLTSGKDYIVVQMQNGDVWELAQCSRSRREDTSNLEYEYDGNKSDFPCLDGYIFDQTKWQSTVVTEWDLVCHREWLAKLIQPTFMFGVLLGAVIFGDLADRVGRRLIMWSTSTGQFLFGIAVAFTFDYYSFMAARFLLAMVSSGYLVVVFVYVTEFIGIKARTWASMHVHAFFAVGIMVVALMGYLVRTWWLYQIFLSITTLPFLLCCWILPETPFWLLSVGKYEEAQKVIDMMARWNNRRSCKISELCSFEQDGITNNDFSATKKHSVIDLFFNWNIARRTLTVWLIWFTGSLGYYVFSLTSVNLGGNEYLNLFLIGAVELPAYIIACIGMDKLGRRNTLIPFLILSALICFLIMLIPQDYSILSILANMAGKFAIGVAFGLIYLYTAELYPTIIRSLAVGSGSMMCRLGSVVAPFCVYLTSIWIFMPQLLVGIMAFLTGMLTLMLPETLGKPLANTWEETMELRTMKDNYSIKSPPTKSDVSSEKIEMINLKALDIDE